MTSSSPVAVIAGHGFTGKTWLTNFICNFTGVPQAPADEEDRRRYRAGLRGGPVPLELTETRYVTRVVACAAPERVTVAFISEAAYLRRFRKLYSESLDPAPSYLVFCMAVCRLLEVGHRACRYEASLGLGLPRLFGATSLCCAFESHDEATTALDQVSAKIREALVAPFNDPKFRDLPGLSLLVEIHVHGHFPGLDFFGLRQVIDTPPFRVRGCFTHPIGKCFTDNIVVADLLAPGHGAGLLLCLGSEGRGFVYEHDLGQFADLEFHGPPLPPQVFVACRRVTLSPKNDDFYSGIPTWLGERSGGEFKMNPSAMDSCLALHCADKSSPWRARLAAQRGVLPSLLCMYPDFASDQIPQEDSAAVLDAITSPLKQAVTLWQELSKK